MDFVQPPSVQPTSYFFVKCIIIVLILGFFLYEFRQPLQDISSFFTSLRQLLLPSATPAKTTETTQKISKKIAQKPTYKPIPQPTIPDTQSPKRYCYVGNWKGVRTCYKLTNQVGCASQQLYDTEEHCEHPELR
jgi:hypothetical protein